MTSRQEQNMTDIASGGQRASLAKTSAVKTAAARTSGKNRAAGIYGAIITAAVLDTAGDRLSTAALVIAVVVTLVVYWLAEQYAEMLGQQAESGHLPTLGQMRAGLAARWPMVTASFVPLLALLLARLAGASGLVAANVGLAVTVVLLLVNTWSAGRAAQLRGHRLLLATAVEGTLGLVMIGLKDLVLIQLH
jgi:hypothetical protein